MQTKRGENYQGENSQRDSLIRRPSSRMQIMVHACVLGCLCLKANKSVHRERERERERERRMSVCAEILRRCKQNQTALHVLVQARLDRIEIEAPEETDPETDWIYLRRVSICHYAVIRRFYHRCRVIPLPF